MLRSRPGGPRSVIMVSALPGPRISGLASVTPAAAVGGFSLLVVLVYVADEYPTSKASLELDRDVLLEHYAAIAPEALNSLIPEERHRLYKLLRITVIVQPDTTLEVSGVFGEGLSVSNQGLVS
jgi:hypothetical protein